MHKTEDKTEDKNTSDILTYLKQKKINKKGKMCNKNQLHNVNTIEVTKVK